LSEKDISDGQLRTNDIFYLGSAFDLPEINGDGIGILFQRAKAAGMVTALDVTSDLTRKHLDKLLPVFPNLSFFMPSQNQAEQLSGEIDPQKAAKLFLSFGCETVVIKLGEKGCLVMSNGLCIHSPAFKIDAIDTTGAGDSFVSGFLFGIARNYDIGKCAELGNAAGALCASAIGATGAVKSLNQLEEFIKINKNHNLEV